MARTRRALGALLAAWVACAVPGCAPEAETSLAPAPPCAELELRAAPHRRSVVLVVNDTMRRDRVGAYGGPARTPAFDRFAAEGLLFEHAYSQAPWTKPSIATLFTGLHPSQHGVLSHPAGGGAALVSDALPGELTTLAEVLAAAGYETAAFVANPWLREELGFAQGFDTWDDAAAANGAPGEPLVRAALGWLAERRDPRPFFLYLHTMDSHAPYPPIAEETLAARKKELAADDRPLSQAARNVIRGAARIESGRSLAELGVPPSIALLGVAYDGGLAQFDGALDRLLAGLAERPDAGELAILVTSDHGEAFFEHGWASHGHGLFDDEIAVPLAAHLPGVTGPARVECPVGLVDVMATLCVYLGVDCPADDFGVSFLPSAGAAREPRWIASEGVLAKPEHRSIRNGDVALFFEPRGRRGAAPPLRADAYALYLDGGLGERRPVPEELKRALASAVSKHAAPRAAGVPLDAETRARLEALGYTEE
jgi:arylsulfatase A-like enzyme